MQVLFPSKGNAFPGECLALLGPSGAGKSTLLDILSLRKNSGKITGDVSLPSPVRPHSSNPCPPTHFPSRAYQHTLNMLCAPARCLPSSSADALPLPRGSVSTDGGACHNCHQLICSSCAQTVERHKSSSDFPHGLLCAITAALPEGEAIRMKLPAVGFVRCAGPC